MVASLLLGLLISAPIEVRVHTGHQAAAVSLAFSPDGKLAASGSVDGTIKIWDTRNWREIRSIGFGTTSGSVPRNVSFSSDGKHVVATSEKLTRLFTRTGELLREFASDEYVLSARLDRAGKVLVTSSGFEYKLRLWNAGTGALVRTIATPEGDQPGPAAISPDGKRIAVTVAGPLVIYDAASGKLLAKQKPDEGSGEARDIAWSPDGKRIATADSSFLRIRDATGKLLHSYEHAGPEETDPRAISVRFSGDGKRIAVGHAYGWVSVWNVATLTKEFGARLDSATVGISAEVSAALSPDGRYLIAADTDSAALHIFDLQTRRKVRVVRGSVATVRSLRFSADGASLLAKSSPAHGDGDQRSWDKTWDLRTGRVVRSDADDLTSEVTRTPDGRLAVVLVRSDKTFKSWDWGGRAGKYQVRDRKTSALLGEYAFENAQTEAVGKVAISDDGTQLAIAYFRKDAGAAKGEDKLDLYRVGERAARQTIAGKFDALAFSPDGGTLALGGKGVCLWDLQSSQCTQRLPDVHDSFVNQLAFLDSGAILVSADGNGNIKVWDGATHALLGALPGFNYFLVRVWRRAAQATGIIALGYDGSLREYDLRERRQVRALETHSTVRTFARSDDGRRLALATDDGQLRLIDLEKLEVMATLVTLEGPENESIAITPDGYYTATRSGTSAVHFVIGEKTYLVDQFDLRYNRPDLVAERLGIAPPALRASFKHAYEKRLKKLGFSEAMLSGEVKLPELSIKNPPPPNTQRKILSLTVEATDIDRFLVQVNDVPMGGSKGIPAGPKGKKKLRRSIEVELTKGINRIQVSALNAAGLESLREVVEVNYDGEAPKPNLYVVAIGVSKYRDPQYELRYAAKDASDLAALFEAHKERYGQIKVIKLLDADATRAGVAKAKETLMGSRVDDQIVAFAAGHGILDEKLDFYFATADIDFQDPAAAGLPYEDLEGMLDGVPARKKLLLIDTCHSGEVDKDEMTLADSTPVAGGTVRARAVGTRGIKRKDGSAPALSLSGSLEAVQNLFADLRRGSGAAVISSAGGAEYALESPEWNNGVFTYAVLEGLKTGSADRDKDGQVRVSELRDYVIDKVQKLTAGKQTPTSRRESLEFDFAIY